jgi:hypothetical protein
MPHEGFPFGDARVDTYVTYVSCNSGGVGGWEVKGETQQKQETEEVGRGSR